jgi:hypothetical protein
MELKEVKLKEEKVKKGKVKEGKVKKGKVKEGEVKEGKVKEGKVKDGKVKEGKDWIGSGSRHTVMMCWAGKAQSPSSSMSNCSGVNGRRRGSRGSHEATA